MFPREIDTETAYFPIDTKVKSSITEYQNGVLNQPMGFINSRINNYPLKLTIDCEGLGEIIVGEYGHTVLTRILDQEDIEGLTRLEQEATNLIPEGITFKPFLKDEKFFLKLQTKEDRYTAMINPPALPSTPEKSPFKRGSTLSIDCQPNIYINFENSSAGIYLTVKEVTIDGGSKKKLTLRKR